VRHRSALVYRHRPADNITGGPGLHGDGIQAQSPVDFVVVEEMTVVSNEQAIFIPVQTVGSTRDFVYLRKVNTHYAQGTDNSYLRSYWFYEGTTTARDDRFPLFPWTLIDVWADDLSQAPETTWVQAVFPQPGFTWGPAIRTDKTGVYAEFPPGLQINGVVRKGQPPGGDFVTPATCGLNYVSPWPLPH